MRERVVWYVHNNGAWLVMKISLAYKGKLRVISLSLSPLCVTRRKPARKNGRVNSWGREARESRISRGLARGTKRKRNYS